MLFSNYKLASMSSDDVAIAFVNDVLKVASYSNASDIHFEPYKETFRVRMRLDGILKNMGDYEPRFHPAITARVKLLGSLDIAERRAPQDGSLRFQFTPQDSEESTEIHFRVSSIPTIYGEKIVLRRLSDKEDIAEIKRLGMDESTLEEWRQLTSRPFGIVLVSGPTGSGKSTTLFATLRILNSEEVNISTIEDPVEYKIEGINQMQINSVKLSFASALRSVLRQDPDVIMVGEIRDRETADIALRASLTGHKVFSTVHTNDTASSITRLLDMGVEPFLVASSLNGVLAQRLVRKICSHCQEFYDSTTEEQLFLHLEQPLTLSRGKGCQECNHTGYSGRTGIYELLPLNSEIRQMIVQRQSDMEIKQYAIHSLGMRSLFQSAREKIITHTTTTEELKRVMGEG